MEQNPQNSSHGWDAWSDVDLPPVEADDLLTHTSFTPSDEPPRQIASVPKVVLAAALTQFSLPLSLADLPVMAATLDNQPPRKTIVSASDVGLFDAQPPGVLAVTQQDGGQVAVPKRTQPVDEVPPSFSIDSAAVQSAAGGPGVNLQPTSSAKPVHPAPQPTVTSGATSGGDTLQPNHTTMRSHEIPLPVQPPVLTDAPPPVQVQRTTQQNSSDRAESPAPARTYGYYRPQEGGDSEIRLEDDGELGDPASPNGAPSPVETQPITMPVLTENQAEVPPSLQSVDPSRLAKAADQGLLTPDLVQRAPLLNPEIAIPPGKVRNQSAGGVYNELLSFIAQGEGGYNSMNQGTSRGKIVGSTDNASEYLGKNLTDMTLSEIVDAQRSGQLFAAGRYQIIPDTMQRALGYTEMSLDEKFSEATQDKLAISLIIEKRPLLGQYLKGDKSVSTREAMIELALEWASAPDPDTGNSMYGDGNQAQHTVEETQIALETARRVISGQQ